MRGLFFVAAHAAPAVKYLIDALFLALIEAANRGRALFLDDRALLAALPGGQSDGGSDEHDLISPSTKRHSNIFTLLKLWFGSHQRRQGLRIRPFIAFSLMLVTSPVWAEPDTCSYETYQWHAMKMRAGPNHWVVKPYAQIRADERDAATGCTVCREDQVEVHLEGVVPVLVCNRLAAQLEHTLRELQARGIPIHTVVGYRVGMTRGAPDAAGYRTQFSNHSYGIALDINEGENGLYESCEEIGPACRLRKGGKWEPYGNSLSMTADHPVVVALKRAGLRWGGEIAGRQKDFMHFSPTGY